MEKDLAGKLATVLTVIENRGWEFRNDHNDSNIRLGGIPFNARNDWNKKCKTLTWTWGLQLTKAEIIQNSEATCGHADVSKIKRGVCNMRTVYVRIWSLPDADRKYKRFKHIICFQKMQNWKELNHKIKVYMILKSKKIYIFSSNTAGNSDIISIIRIIRVRHLHFGVSGRQVTVHNLFFVIARPVKGLFAVYRNFRKCSQATS